MNTETKRHIDSARQVLVGVVPNPTSQIDQITNALIYKFMDDMDQAAIKAGGDSSFFVGDLEKYAWTRLMDSRLGNQERMNLYSEALLKFSESKQLPELFRGIFKSAFLPYRSPETLGMFLKEINYFDYSHPEELGNAYEYLLSIMSSQGDAGQFRTPRHIIDFIVEAVNPTKDDKVLDPACGTAGFLISAYKHILKQHDGLDDPNKKEKPLTPDQRKNLFNNFEGYDIDPGMVRIAEVNMYLHQFKNPKIFQYDTLSMEERWNDKFDVIMANPPFMSPKGGIKPHTKFSIQSSRSEVLFVDYIINHLRPKGRAGVIVPEGIIFQSGIAYKQLRKNLVEDGLYAVVSLPGGVFQPYSGVKTSILLFDNEISKKSEHILFIKIQNDGFGLGAQRRLVMGSDLPLALEVLLKYKKHHESNGTTSITGWPEGEYQIDTYPNCFFVSKEEISKSGDYSLSGDRYRTTTDYSNIKWPMVELGKICTFIGGYAFKSEELEKVRKAQDYLPVVKIGNVDKSGNLEITNAQYFKYKATLKKFLILKDDILIAMTGATVGKVAYSQADNLLLNQRVGLVRADENKILKPFLKSLLLSEKFYEFCQLEAGGGAQGNISPNQIQRYQVPLPPLEIQKQIVDELDSYQKIVNGSKYVVACWKPIIDIDPKWDKRELENVLNRVSEQINPINKNGDVFYIGLENIESGTGTIVGNPKAKYENIKSLKNVFKRDDILYGKLRPNLNKVWLADRDGICSTDILVFRGTDKSITNFYWYLMLSESFVNKVMVGIKGAQLPRVGFEHLKNLILPLPPLEVQKQIIEKIEAERVLVESAKKLIEIYEQKVKNTIVTLWEE